MIGVTTQTPLSERHWRKGPAFISSLASASSELIFLPFLCYSVSLANVIHLIECTLHAILLWVQTLLVCILNYVIRKKQHLRTNLISPISDLKKKKENIFYKKCKANTSVNQQNKLHRPWHINKTEICCNKLHLMIMSSSKLN